MFEKRYYNETIQIMRGMAIIMVVLQHSISRVAESELEYKIMYFFNHIDVAVFFVIAGYLFEIKKRKYYQENMYSYFKEKMKSLLVPYFFWSLILAIGIKLVGIFLPDLQGIMDKQSWTWKEIFFNTILFRDYYIQHLWFIYILFLFFIINRLFKDMLINTKIFGVILICCLIFQNMELNYILNKFVLHFAVFLAGRMIVKYSLLHWLNNQYLKIVAPCVLLLCFFTELLTSNSFTYTYIGNTLYALTGVYCVYLAAKIVTTIPEVKYRLHRIGNYSFEIYLMHNPYVSVVVPIVLGKMKINSLIIVIMTTIAGILLPYYIAKILFNYTPHVTAVLFGRKGK